eukprot:GHVR01091392.1.p1 GENE.GHVR01091392.1~~GHVR01091392.1.p1  ORF type:complete len:317 (-),score=62.19 GHVR01091392.1:202-1152(-)
MGYVMSSHSKCVANVNLYGLPTDSHGATVDTVSCDRGRHDEHGSCFKEHYSEAVSACGSGHHSSTVSQGDCFTYVAVPADRVCPHGFETANTGITTECVKTKVMKAHCPKHFKRKDNTCVRKIKTKPCTACPPGTDFSHNECIQVDIVPASAYCEHEGYELSDEGCVLPGYAVPGDDKLYDMHYTCDKGYDFNKSDLLCYAYEKTPPTLRCLDGFLPEGYKCIRYLQVPAEPSCKHGYNYTDGQGCTKVTYDHPHFKCPPGTKRHFKQCYVYETDSSYTTYAQTQGVPVVGGVGVPLETYYNDHPAGQTLLNRHHN